MKERLLSVLIISFNCWDLLSDCLCSLHNSDNNFHEIVVVDNASVDETCKMLPKAFPEVRLLQNRTNVGHTKAVNQGCKEISGTHILLLDADTELAPDCISKMMGFMEIYPDISMVAPRTYNSDGSVQESARDFPSPINGVFGRQSMLTRLFPNNTFSRRYLAQHNLNSSAPFQVEQISAACMLFKRDLLDLVGYWDEGYSGYWVDSDWCKKIQKKGEKIFCVPQASIVHHEQNKHTIKKNPVRIIAFHQGVYRFYRLHYTLGFWDPRSISLPVYYRYDVFCCFWPIP